MPTKVAPGKDVPPHEGPPSPSHHEQSSTHEVIGEGVVHVLSFVIACFVVAAGFTFLPIFTYRSYHCLTSAYKCRHLFDPLPIEFFSHEWNEGCDFLFFTYYQCKYAVWLFDQIVLNDGPRWLRYPEVVEANDAAETQQRKDFPMVVWRTLYSTMVGVSDMTARQILGIDGALVFMLLALRFLVMNFTFTVVYVSFPGLFGLLAAYILQFSHYLSSSDYEMMVINILGNCIICIFLYFVFKVATMYRKVRLRFVVGVYYLIDKVAIEGAFEMFKLPILCGSLVAYVTMEGFSDSPWDRLARFQDSPLLVLLIHWVVGFLYLLYFKAVLVSIKEVVRPQLLDNVRVLRNPRFTNIQEKIHLPIAEYMKDFIIALAIIVFSIIVILLIPTIIIARYFPSIFDPNLAYFIKDWLSSGLKIFKMRKQESDGDLSSEELLLLNMLLPGAFMFFGVAHHWATYMIRSWCIVFASPLGLRPYILADKGAVYYYKIPWTRVGQPEVHSRQHLFRQRVKTLFHRRKTYTEVEEEARPDENVDLYKKEAIHIVPRTQQHANTNAAEAAEKADKAVPLVTKGGPEQSSSAQLKQGTAASSAAPPPTAPTKIGTAGPSRVATVPPTRVESRTPSKLLVVQGGRGPSHLILVPVGGDMENAPALLAIERPSVLPLRILILVVLLCLSIISSACVAFIIPVVVGRTVIQLLINNPKYRQVEIAFLGLFTTWVMVRLVVVAVTWYGKAQDIVEENWT